MANTERVFNPQLLELEVIVSIGVKVNQVLPLQDALVPLMFAESLSPIVMVNMGARPLRPL